MKKSSSTFKKWSSSHSESIDQLVRFTQSTRVYIENENHNLILFGCHLCRPGICVSYFRWLSPTFTHRQTKFLISYSISDFQTTQTGIFRWPKALFRWICKPFDRTIGRRTLVIKLKWHSFWLSFSRRITHILMQFIFILVKRAFLRSLTCKLFAMCTVKNLFCSREIA